MANEFAAASAWFTQGLARLYQDGDLTDVTVKCDDKSWRVHKAILCAHSAVFAKALNGNFKEAQENVIHIDGASRALDMLVSYLYTLDYSVTDDATPERHVEVFKLGEKYMIPPLQTVATNKLRTVLIGGGWATDSFADAIADIYANVDDRDGSLKKVILDTVVKHAEQLFEDSKEPMYFQKVTAATPQFGIDVAKSLVRFRKENESVCFYYCPSRKCSGVFKSAVNDGYYLAHHCQWCGGTWTKTHGEWSSYGLDIPEGLLPLEISRV